MDACQLVLKAAGDPKRVRILKMLEQGELCVCNIMAVLGLSQSTVSEHLALLKKAGLVTDRREGRWVHYTLASQAQNDYSLPLLALLRGWLNDDGQIAADRRRLEQNTGGEENCITLPTSSIREG